MKIAFLLLSADPIHCGHVSLCSRVINDNYADKVYVTPTVCNPWKDNPIGTFEERCEMIRKAIAPIDNCELEDIEKDLFPPYYSCFTLDALYKKYDGENNELYIVGGVDVVDSLPDWMRYDELIKGRFKVLAFTREGKSPHTNEVQYELIESDFPDLSSTYVRELLSQGKCAYPYVPAAILKDCENIYGDSDRIRDFII